MRIKSSSVLFIVLNLIDWLFLCLSYIIRLFYISYIIRLFYVSHTLLDFFMSLYHY